MAGTMVMRSANPALGDHTFDRVRPLPGTEQMTLGGTVNKTGLSLLILLFTASFIWNRGADDPALGAWILVSVVAALIVAMVTVFKQTLAPYTTPIYAALEGVALGCAAHGVFDPRQSVGARRQWEITDLHGNVGAAAKHRRPRGWPCERRPAGGGGPGRQVELCKCHDHQHRRGLQ